MHEFRLAVRRLIKKPTFALLAIATLAIGLGASSAIFSVVDAILIRPLPYDAPDRLVSVSHSAPGLDMEELGMSRRLFVHYREHTESFTDIGLYTEGPAAVSGLDRPIEVSGATITPSVLRILRSLPAHGRAFVEGEGAPGGDSVVIVSDEFWHRHLGAAHDVLERSITVDGTTRQIVGVMPAGFDFPSVEVEVWVPDVIAPEREPLGRFGRFGIARLADGITAPQATSDLMRFAGDLLTIFPDEGAARVLSEGAFAAHVKPLRDAVVGDVGPVLWLLLATVGFVLLLAAINVTNLFLARASDERHETAIRRALGAKRGSLVRAAFAEGLLIASLAAAAGIGISHLGLDLLRRVAPDRLPRMHEAAIDLRTLAVVGGSALLCGMVFGLIPMFRTGGSAIGAQRARIIALVLREGMTLALLGGMVGLAAAVLLSRFLESILYEVDPREPLTLVGVYLLLLTVAAIACLVPARRAATVDPAIALRHD